MTTFVPTPTWYLDEVRSGLGKVCLKRGAPSDCLREKGRLFYLWTREALNLVFLV